MADHKKNSQDAAYQMDSIGTNEVKKKESTHEKSALKYGLNVNPPWHLSLLLGFQHYLTMLGGSISLPVILAPAFCIHNDEVAKTNLLNTMIFVTGISTILQVTIGTRLPIIQGPTFTMIAPVFAIFATRKCPAYTNHKSTKCDYLLEVLNGDDSIYNADFRQEVLYNLTDGGISVYNTSEHEELWQGRMREIQGAIAIASVVQVFVGATGMVGSILWYIGPMTVAPTISLIGLALFMDAASFCAVHWGISILSIILMTIFSQCLRRGFPVCSFTRAKGCHMSSYPIFELFPVVWTIAITWGFCAILTAAGVMTDDPLDPTYGGRSDAKIRALTDSDWFRVPYPGQWGPPTAHVAGVLGMLGGVIAGILESIGDYYACAELVEAPTPPVHAVNRGIFIEGIGCVLAGFWGSGAGTTSYTENLSVMAVTKVGSRRVILISGIMMVIIGSFAKFGAIFISIPDPIVGGLTVVLFGIIGSIGISNLRYTDMKSPRNLYILGLTMFFGLMVPFWLRANPTAINTGVDVIDQILQVLLGTSMFLGGVIAFILDNIVPGTDEERGIAQWRRQLKRDKKVANEQDGTYDIPYITNWIRKHRWMRKIPISPTYEGLGIRCPSSRCRNKVEDNAGDNVISKTRF